MNRIVFSLAIGVTALLATAATATAAPLSNGAAIYPSDVENVRLVCNENGRCFRERRERRVIIRARDSYPRERYIERRGYEDRGGGIGFNAPGVSVGGRAISRSE